MFVKNSKMWLWGFFFFCFVDLSVVKANKTWYQHQPEDYAAQQLPLYRIKTKEEPLLTVSNGEPVDIRKVSTLNRDILTNEYAIDSILAADNERIPERFVHAQGSGAFGYFEVLNDVSKYTKIKAFNKVGKKTPVVVRFSNALQNKGGNELTRDLRGFAIKYYTEDGVFDTLTLSSPVFFLRDPSDFVNFIHASKRNPVTNLPDSNARMDFFSLRPISFHALLYVMSDYGIPRTYRKMDTFVEHTFELYNDHGEKYYARFNYRSEQGVDNYTDTEAAAIASNDPNYFTRDLYNAIANKDYPSWILEMYVMSEHDITKVDFDPFDITRMWEEGTYKSVNIGRLTLNKNPINYHAEVEQLAFSPSHIVPGTTGSPDKIFQMRRLSYPNTARNRLGINFQKVGVNRPDYVKTYNRDGSPPVDYNMKDAPNYYPNSYHGPQPFVDAAAPEGRINLISSTAVDLAPANYFYNHYLRNEGERQRLVNNIAQLLAMTEQTIQGRSLELLSRIDHVLGKRVQNALRIAIETARRQAAERFKAEQKRTPRLTVHLEREYYSFYEDDK